VLGSCLLQVQQQVLLAPHRQHRCQQQQQQQRQPAVWCKLRGQLLWPALCQLLLA
jgi:hypothetical protein